MAELKRIYYTTARRLGYRSFSRIEGADVIELKRMLHALGYWKPTLAVFPSAPAGTNTPQMQELRKTNPAAFEKAQTEARQASAAYTRDSLEVLHAAFSGPEASMAHWTPVDVENDTFTVHNPLDLAPVAPLPVLVAALGPVMLALAGERADGTVLWMADERAIAAHVVPRITKAAEAAGRPAPRVVAGIPVCLCLPSEIPAARERANRILGEAEISPNYQRLLEHGDARDVGDLCAAGDEAAIAARFRSFAEAGVTDLSIRLLPIGNNRDELVASKLRTREMLAALAKDQK